MMGAVASIELHYLHVFLSPATTGDCRPQFIELSNEPMCEPGGQLYVNPGIGYGVGRNLRLNCRPEITIFHL
jgi:predicted MPP superfamily phosphohydrolase